jgi:hypothetical protein
MNFLAKRIFLLARACKFDRSFSDQRPAREAEKQGLPFLDTYRTMYLAPQPDFRRVLEDVRAMQLAA